MTLPEAQPNQTTQRRIWSEFVPYGHLVQPDSLARLREENVGLLIAVMPEHLAGVVDVAKALRDCDLRWGIWPMLSNEAGRWLNAGNADRFAGHLQPILDALAAANALPAEVAFNLEPDYARMRQLVAHPVRATWNGDLRRGTATRAYAQAHKVCKDLVTTVHQAGAEALAAITPPVLWDSPRNTNWQRILGTPLEGIPYDTISVMCYTSLFEGYLRHVQRADARGLLQQLCLRTRERFGRRASVSLGIVGEGALEDEQAYRSVTELIEDVAIARAAGIEDIALHGFAGMLGRGDSAAWLNALLHTAPAPPSEIVQTPLSEFLVRGATLASQAQNLIRRWIP